MHGKRFGELLARAVELSGHDVFEILEEQAISGRRFGEIALAWGLCEPPHIWEAWWTQLGDGPRHMDLRSAGVDGQAVALLPLFTAETLGVIPVRATGEHVVVAVSEPGLRRADRELRGRMRQEVRFALADAAQIREAIRSAYACAVRIPQAVPVAA